MPRVWNLRDPGCPESAVYCGRGSPQGNPYKVGLLFNRDKCCDLFRDNVLPQLNVSHLRGQDLKCFCKPKRCHCDDIIIKANCDQLICIYPRCESGCRGRDAYKRDEGQRGSV